MRQPRRATVALLWAARSAGAFFLQSGALLPGPVGSLTDGADSDDLVSHLWEGLDLRSTVDRSKLQRTRLVRLRPRMPRARRQHLRGPDKKLVLLGPFDTGTHLLLDTLTKNYPNHMYDACDWATLVVDNDRTAHCRLWKHGMNISDSKHVKGGEPVYKVLARQGVQPEDTVVVMLVRSPLATLTAWKKASYDLVACAERNLDHYDEACSAFHMTWQGDGQPSDMPPVSFSSTIDAYNRYMRMYSAIRGEGRFHESLLVTYEDLVLSPADVVNVIADAVGWPQRHSVAMIDSPAKNHGGAVGRSRALEKLRGREWLQMIPSDVARKAMCKGLDTAAIEGISDNSYSPDEPSRNYTFDCEGYL